MDSGESKKPVALVTGAGRGIGRETATLLARKGYSLALVARTFDQLSETRRLTELPPASCLLVLADLAEPEAPSQVVETVVEHFGSIDALINNAGWAPSRRDLTKTSEADLDRILAVNLRAPIALARLAIEQMLKQRAGTIVNVASRAGLVAPAKESVYAAAKAGLIAFTRSLFCEMRGSGLNISVVIPGLVDTELIPANKRLDRDKMLRPADIASAIMQIVDAAPGVAPLELVIEPRSDPERR